MSDAGPRTGSVGTSGGQWGRHPGYMPEPQGKVGEVVSRVPHVEGLRQTHLRSSEIKYLI